MPCLSSSLRGGGGRLAGDGLAGTLAGARVGVRALAANGETLAMTEAAVAAEVHQALDVRADLVAEIAFDLEAVLVRLEQIADLLDVGLGQLLHFLLRRDAGARADLERELASDSIEVRQRVRDLFVTGKINTSNTSQYAP